MGYKNIPKIYLSFLSYQLVDHGYMIYKGDKVEFDKGLVGKVVDVNLDGGAIAGLDDLKYKIDVNGTSYLRDRLGLKIVSQTKSNERIEKILKKVNNAFDSVGVPHSHAGGCGSD
jgi:hypothetical protein